MRNRGEGKFYVILGLLLLAGLVYGVVLFGPVFQRKWKFGNDMEDTLRVGFAREGADKVISDSIHKAQALGLPPLTEDDFTCDPCEVDQMSNFTCDYTEKIEFPGGKVYEMPIHIEVKIKIPPPAF